MDSFVTLVVAQAPETAAPSDRLGGETHGIIRSAFGRTVDIPYERFSDQLEKAIELVQKVAERVKAQVADYAADEISIGLAISAEGSIGIATAGVEASVHVTFKRR